MPDKRAEEYAERIADLVGFSATVKNAAGTTVADVLTTFASQVRAEQRESSEKRGREQFAAELLNQLDKITSTTAAYHFVRNICLIEIGREPNSTGALIDEEASGNG